MSKTISVRLPDDLYEILIEFKKQHGVSIADVVITGILSQVQPAKIKPCYPMADTEKTLVGAPGETVYIPDPVKPAKQPKQSVSKAAAPIVEAMLSGIKSKVTVQHHPTCTCAMCKLSKV